MMYHRRVTSTERQRLIIRHLRRETSGSVSELSRKLGMNRETLRRDLIKLEGDDIIIRYDGRISLKEGAAARSGLSEYGVLMQGERQQEIMRLIGLKHTMRITTLARDLHVTTATIRSDLKKLENEGVLILGHGFASVPEHHPASWKETESMAGRQMELIVARARSHLESGDTVFLDDSSFSRQLAETIDKARDLTVVTNSLVIAGTLTERMYPCEVLTLSGKLNNVTKKMEPFAEQPLLDGLHIDKALLGLRGISSDLMCLPENLLPDELVRSILRKTRRIFLCVRSENLGVVQSEGSLSLSEFSVDSAEIIIDDAVDNELARDILPADMPVTICGTDSAYALQRNIGKNIGFSLFPGHSDFRTEVRESIEVSCKKKHNYQLHTRHNNGDYESIIECVNDLLKQDVDLLIDYSSNFDVGVLVAQKAAERSIPLIMIDLPVQDAVYFGANNVVAGKMAGEMAAREINRLWNGKVSQVISLERETAGSACNQRVVGTIDALREHVTLNARNIKHIDCSRGVQYYGSRLERCLDRLAPDDTCLVVSFAEDITVDTHDIVLEYARTRQILMVGQNYSHYVEHVMQSEGSPFIGCVSYGPDHYGEQIIEIASRMLEGQGVNPINYNQLTWIPNIHWRHTDAFRPIRQ